MKPALASLLLLVACSSVTPPHEICGNGIDDDGNGQTDCEDPACAGQTGCQVVDAGYWGSCPKCGMACTKQTDCSAGRMLDERPIPQCGMSKCQLFNRPVSLRIDYNTAGWGGITAMAFSAVSTRWISKTALDGSAATCATVTAASSMTDPSALETSGKFALLGYDVTSFMGSSGSVPMPLQIPYVYVGSGSNYLLYTETWTGARDATTHLPTGMRRSAGCVESGADVAAITDADDCGGDAGGCRTLNPILPAP
jgi:hypothetical protein